MSLEVDLGHHLPALEIQASFRSDGGLTALFGRSGAGKTTIVNMIGGLIRPMRGRVVLDGEPLVDTARGVFVPRHKRRIGYVFQEARLFPHLSVRQNLLYGRYFTRRRDRFGSYDDIVDLLGLGHLTDRRPGALSGGERQRVALGRALLACPRLLLMDEPLASLDAARKAEILPHLEHLRDGLRIPIVYVSHSVAEVARLASNLVVISDGKTVASGPAADILSSLELRPLTGRFEAGAVLTARVEGHDQRYGMTLLAHRAGSLRVPKLDLETGATARLHVRARDVAVATRRPEQISIRNVLPARVEAIETDGLPIVEVRLDLAGEPLLARLTLEAVEDLGLRPGLEVFALIKSVAFDRRGTGVVPGEID